MVIYLKGQWEDTNIDVNTAITELLIYIRFHSLLLLVCFFFSKWQKVAAHATSMCV